jgi:septal ring factor EnvC (AmiA/AmiB activator)
MSSMMSKLFFYFLIITFCTVSFGQSKSELEKKRNSTLKEIEETENILNTVKQSKNESVEKLNLIDKKINLRNTLIVNLSSEVNVVNRKITELEKATNSLGSDIKNIKAEYARMIYLAYLNRAHSNKLMYILSSNSLNQAYKRIKYLKQYSEYRQKQILIISSVQVSLNSQIAELESKKKEKVLLLSSQEKENKNLKNELDEKTKTINVLKLKESELNKRLKAQSKRAEKLAAEIDNIIKAEIKAKGEAEKVSKKISLDDTHLSNNFRDNKGKLPWPTDRGVITRGFGKYRDPIYKNVELESLGIDISTVANSDVHAIFEGQVTDKFLISGYNYAVIINHGRFYTVYQNLVDVRVNKNDKVKTKQVIGKVFTDSESKSSILHVQIWDLRKVLDPEMWLTRN